MTAYHIARDDAEIDRVLDEAHEGIAAGRSRYPGMSFEEGVAQGIEWACGLTDDEAPL